MCAALTDCGLETHCASHNPALMAVRGSHGARFTWACGVGARAQHALGVLGVRDDGSPLASVWVTSPPSAILLSSQRAEQRGGEQGGVGGGRSWNLVSIPCLSFIDATVITEARVQIHLLSALP